MDQSYFRWMEMNFFCNRIANYLLGHKHSPVYPLHRKYTINKYMLLKQNKQYTARVTTNCFSSLRVHLRWEFPFFFFVFLPFLGQLPTAYGGSQARGLIGATASGLYQCHSNMGSKLHLRPTPQQCQILNPLSKARDRTWNLMVPSRIR